MKRHRRRFLIESSAWTAGAVLTRGAAAKAAASERVRVGVMGAGGRARALIRSFAQHPEVELVAVADLDANRLPEGLQEAAPFQRQPIRAESDFRRLIDDPSIDALVVGTPDHWHAIPTILACQAGKDVYVEKPDGHNIVEGQRMVAAMRRHGRIVQMGSQHRSTQRLQSALEFARSGKLGKCLTAKAWESARQGAIGFPADEPPPPGVDYDMWLGPAPQRAFNRNRFHGTWRWFFDYGTGDLGNDGVHRLDMALAVLNAAAEAQGEPPVRLPRRISAAGGKWYFDDAQEFPDTLQVTYQFDARPAPKILTYEMRLWAPYPYLGQSEGAAVFGDEAYLIVTNKEWVAATKRGEVLAQGAGDSSEAPHVANFIACLKSRQRPYCDLETVGHPASVICHAGNIAARVGRELLLDPETEEFLDDPAANALRTRPEYRRPWLLPEVG